MTAAFVENCLENRLGFVETIERAAKLGGFVAHFAKNPNSAQTFRLGGEIEISLNDFGLESILFGIVASAVVEDIPRGALPHFMNFSPKDEIVEQGFPDYLRIIPRDKPRQFHHTRSVLEIRLWRKPENSRREQETYLSWSRAEAADGRIQEAIEILLQARPSHETSELLTDLRLQRCEEAVRSLRAAVPAEEEIKESEDGAPARHTVRDIKYAAEIGAELDDVDSILTYFRALAECGYEPGAVYPDGVEVIDVPTGSYQLPEDRKAAQADQNQTVPLEGKGLIFTREQIIPDDPKQYLSQTEHVIVERPWNPADDSLYRVKLQPAELYQLPEERRAESIAECSWIYLADTVYRVSGTAVMALILTYLWLKIRHSSLHEQES